MASKIDDKKQLKCSFCGKPQDQVKKLIAGPDVYICDECVDLCVDLVNEDLENSPVMTSGKLPKPKKDRPRRDRKMACRAVFYRPAGPQTDFLLLRRNPHASNSRP